MELNFKSGSTQSKVFDVLRDQQWHCRKHGYPAGVSGQLAGGGGIQGLQRGSGARPGLCIETESRECVKCKRKTKHDRWTGQFRTAVTARSIPSNVAERIRVYFKSRDVVEDLKRHADELVIDHKFPMLRWDGPDSHLDFGVTIEQICEHFQLLKKDRVGNHNLLKSRACEACKDSGVRGTPFGVKFFYSGGPDWPAEIPPTGKGAEQGCVGCGWYDFAKWREGLNQVVVSKRD